jgi:hypothetical protein
VSYNRKARNEQNDGRGHALALMQRSDVSGVFDEMVKPGGLDNAQSSSQKFY